jgi:hypothetical protein
MSEKTDIPFAILRLSGRGITRTPEERTENAPMTAEEKKRDLYLRQKHTLDLFLEHGAISQAQYDKSLGDLTVKMGMEPNGNPKV